MGAAASDPGSQGKWAEQVARDHLEAYGLETLELNFRSRHGEIDLVMRDNAALVFVEVRFRKTGHFGTGAESITSEKRRRLIATALQYLQHIAANETQACRFDVISISGSDGNLLVDWIKDAFEA